MKRRDLVLSGTAALAAVGITKAAMGQTTTTAPATVKTSPSVFDFGAKGDGVTDDSAAFIKALQVASTQMRKVIVPGYTYAIAKTINWASTAHVTRSWGLQCQGAVLQSKITNGTDVVLMTSNHTVRYLQIDGGLSIKGTGTDKNGLRLYCPATGGKYFYNATLENLSIEGVGGHGLLMEGNVFESTVANSFFQDCKQNGATFAHSKGGVCSAISVVNCYLNQNGNYGLAATNFDNQYGGASDVRVYGGYCRENKSYGFYYNNGTSPGASIQQVGFENNCRNLAPGDPNGAHVYGLVRMQLRDCSGFNMFGGATHLLRGWFTSLATIEGCSQSAGGAMATTGKSRLVQVDGSSSGHVLMRASAGGVAVKSGTTCTWSAENCSGPSPLGDLSMRKTIGTA